MEFSILDEEAGEGNIDEILPRKNALVRPAAANVDQALVLFALTQPSPNLNLLDRFLVMMAMEDPDGGNNRADPGGYGGDSGSDLL